MRVSWLFIVVAIAIKVFIKSISVVPSACLTVLTYEVNPEISVELGRALT